MLGLKAEMNVKQNAIDGFLKQIEEIKNELSEQQACFKNFG